MAKINEIDITSLTFQEGSAPTTPASTKWKIYTKTDGLYVIDDAGTETGPLSTGGGGGAAAPAWISYFNARQTGETSGDDDDFFDDATDAGTKIAPTGSSTFTEKYDALYMYATGESTNDITANAYALTPSSAPVTIETHIRGMLNSGSFPMMGVFLSDGTAATSTLTSMAVYGTTEQHRSGTFTNFATTTEQPTLTPWTYSAGPVDIYFRIIWTATNTFKAGLSPNGVNWSYGSANAYTLSPTHFGVFGSAFGAGDSFLAFDYLRVNSADLSA